MTLIQPAEGVKGPMIAKMLGRNPNIFAGFLRFDSAFRHKGTLSPKIREAVRRATAHITGCEYCNSLGAVEDLQNDLRTQLAVQLAQDLATNSGEIEPILFQRLQGVFTVEELVELVAWTCFVCIGGQLFGAALGLEPATACEAERFEKWALGER